MALYLFFIQVFSNNGQGSKNATMLSMVYFVFKFSWPFRFQTIHWIVVPQPLLFWIDCHLNPWNIRDFHSKSLIFYFPKLPTNLSHCGWHCYVVLLLMQYILLTVLFCIFMLLDRDGSHRCWKDIYSEH